MITLETLKVSRKPIVVFGTGYHAARCIYGLSKWGIEIEYFLNNDPDIKSFRNIPVYTPNKENIQNVFIIVGSMEQTYFEIAEQLQSMELEEFTDYIYYGWLGKPIVLLHGNCHMAVIKEYLYSSRYFKQYYAIYPNPLICENELGKIEEIVLKNCDIWIHQDIKEDNGYSYELSDVFLRQKIKKSALDITVPNLYGMGKILFPQVGISKDSNCANKNVLNVNGIFPFVDRIIESNLEGGKNCEEIVALCKKDFVMSEEEVRNNFELYLEKIIQREQNWDVKIYEFILSNYRKVKLFYDPSHPTNYILKKIAIGLLEKLGIDDGDIHAENKLNMHEIPVYPTVKKILQLEWDEKELRQGSITKKLSDKMDFEEYVREYVWWCDESTTDDI